MLEQLNRTPQPSQEMDPPQNQKAPQNFAQDVPQHTVQSESQRQQDLEDCGAHAGGEEFLEKVKRHFSGCNSFTCQSRGEKCPEQLQSHLSGTPQPPQKYVCTHEKRGKAFERDFQLANHVKYDHSDGHYMIQYKCKECQSNFSSVGALNIHHLESGHSAEQSSKVRKC